MDSDRRVSMRILRGRIIVLVLTLTQAALLALPSVAICCRTEDDASSAAHDQCPLHHSGHGGQATNGKVEDAGQLCGCAPSPLSSATLIAQVWPDAVLSSGAVIQAPRQTVEAVPSLSLSATRLASPPLSPPPRS
jgi:hypothetical protein